MFVFNHTVFCRWGQVTDIVGNGCRIVFNCVCTWDSKRSHKRLFCSLTVDAIKLGKFSICDWKYKKIDFVFFDSKVSISNKK